MLFFCQENIFIFFRKEKTRRVTPAGFGEHGEISLRAAAYAFGIRFVVLLR